MTRILMTAVPRALVLPVFEDVGRRPTSSFEVWEEEDP